MFHCISVPKHDSEQSGEEETGVEKLSKSVRAQGKEI